MKAIIDMNTHASVTPQPSVPVGGPLATNSSDVTQLAASSIDPYTIVDSHDNARSDDDMPSCSICHAEFLITTESHGAHVLRDPEQERQHLICGHAFHKGCLDEMQAFLKKTRFPCPVCRTEPTLDQVAVLTGHDQPAVSSSACARPH